MPGRISSTDSENQLLAAMRASHRGGTLQRFDERSLGLIEGYEYYIDLKDNTLMVSYSGLSNFDTRIARFHGSLKSTGVASSKTAAAQRRD